MNKYAAITLLATVLVGCDNNTAPLSFTPEMASFSNEFDFDPLRGPVKDFTQTLFNDKGEVSKRVTGTMSTEGCFDTLELHDLDANTGVALVLDANYGFVVAAHSKEMEVKYQYDADGYPLGKTTVSGDKRLSVKSVPSKDLRKRMDYTAVSLLNDKPMGNVKQSCDYDRHNNPVSCELVITDDSVKPAVEHKYTIKNSIEYY